MDIPKISIDINSVLCDVINTYVPIYQSSNGLLLSVDERVLDILDISFRNLLASSQVESMDSLPE